jgi:hypothetical protein
VPAGKWRVTCAYLNSELPFTGAWTGYDRLEDTRRSMERNTGRAICLGDLFLRTTPSERQNYPDSGSLLSIETFYYPFPFTRVPRGLKACCRHSFSFLWLLKHCPQK